MPTYQEYLTHCQQRGFQPLREVAFLNMVNIGFNPIVGAYLDGKKPYKTAQLKAAQQVWSNGECRTLPAETFVAVKYVGHDTSKRAIWRCTHDGIEFNLAESRLTNFVL